MRPGLAAVAAIALLGASAPAQAKVMIATYHAVGTDLGANTQTSTDAFDIFGLGGGFNPFAGQAIDLSVTYDADDPSRVTFLPYLDYIQGGSSIHTANPLIAATVTINGITKAPVLGDFGKLGLFGFRSPSGGLEIIMESHGAEGAYFSGFNLDASFPTMTPTSLADPYSITGFCGACGYFQILDGRRSPAFSSLDLVGFDIREAPPPGVSAVPEPGPWALMILGFGLAGGVLRRRRARSAMAG